MKGVVPGVGETDRVLLWPGGIWNWFDPVSVIDAVADLAARRDDVRLVFLGLRHPNPTVPEMYATRRAVARAEALGLRDRVVFFNEGWVPYERRGAYLLEADLGVSAHFDDLESRFAFRTRLLDCFWADLPVVTTAGDSLGDLVERRGVGRAVAPRDVDAWVERSSRCSTTRTHAAGRAMRSPTCARSSCGRASSSRCGGRVRLKASPSHVGALRPRRQLGRVARAARPGRSRSPRCAAAAGTARCAVGGKASGTLAPV